LVAPQGEPVIASLARAIVIFFKAMQPSKAVLAIVAKVLGKLTLASAVQPLKALPSMAVIAENFAVFKAALFKKQQLLTFVA
jgi:hypothetical protein